VKWASAAPHGNRVLRAQGGFWEGGRPSLASQRRGASNVSACGPQHFRAFVLWEAKREPLAAALPLCREGDNTQQASPLA